MESKEVRVSPNIKPLQAEFATDRLSLLNLVVADVAQLVYPAVVAAAEYWSWSTNDRPIATPILKTIAIE